MRSIGRIETNRRVFMTSLLGIIPASLLGKKPKYYNPLGDEFEYNGWWICWDDISYAWHALNKHKEGVFVVTLGITQEAKELALEKLLRLLNRRAHVRTIQRS
jgi:hypothetical protein